MSEYQNVAFRAIDGPVSEKNLQYMRQQSSRAEITAWSFDNEYHYGDFRGKAEEMLRRGYDFHLHYANFGIRKLMIRLPGGLPDPVAAAPYLDDDGFVFLKDKTGRGGILSIDPSHDAGSLDELWDIEPMVEALLPIRAEILDGDLRPLYLARLGVGIDMNHDPEEAHEGPVPAGMKKLTRAQRALADFYGLSEALLAVAAKPSPALTQKGDLNADYAAWVARQPESARNAWLVRLMQDPGTSARREVLTEWQKTHAGTTWPTVVVGRTIAQLVSGEDDMQEELDRKENEAQARRRMTMLAGMRAKPQEAIRKTEKLVDEGSTRSYSEAAEMLADLREALAGTAQAKLAEQQARKLKTEHPTLNRLTRALREKGFLPK